MKFKSRKENLFFSKEKVWISNIIRWISKASLWISNFYSKNQGIIFKIERKSSKFNQWALNENFILKMSLLILWNRKVLSASKNNRQISNNYLKNSNINPCISNISFFHLIFFIYKYTFKYYSLTLLSHRIVLDVKNKALEKFEIQRIFFEFERIFLNVKKI